MRRRLACLALIAAALLAVACGGKRYETPPSAVTPQPAGWTWQLDNQGALAFAYGGRALFTLNYVDAVGFTPQVWSFVGFFHFNRSNVRDRLLNLSPTADAGRFLLYCAGAQIGTLTIAETANGDLRVAASLDRNQAGQGLKFGFALGSDDRFWGFGEQYNFVDLRGQRFPIWTQEQGVGRTANPLLPTVGTLTDTYYPLPYFMDPKRGAGFLLENTEYSVFDLGAADPTRWSVEVWNGRAASFLLFPGPRPAEVVAQLTRATGRPAAPPPSWAFSGVWLAGQGGEDAVQQRLDVAAGAGIPVAAIWVQDWVGERSFGPFGSGVEYHWTADDALYPNLSQFIAGLAAKDVRFLGYFNPFVVLALDQYAEALQGGYLIRRSDGAPYLQLIVTYYGSQLDVFNPAAGAWFQRYARAAAALGMKGWMADFGEWLPFDAALAQGDGPSSHNLYPTAWHELNRAALADAYPDGDYVMLTRSGYTGEAGVAQIVWAGDQTADWDAGDGLPTVVTAGLTSGLSGVPIFTHDIAGFSGGPSTRELFERWAELGALTPVMRTHDGALKNENHHFDSDPETLAHFTKMSQLHASLASYFEQVAAETVTDGLPMVRHTVLVDPDWDAAYEANWQWMIGSDVLVAPVVTEGATAVTVHFPAGRWRHLLTGEIYEGRQIATVFAPIGRPAAFQRTD
jgi:alpha-glucosidase